MSYYPQFGFNGFGGTPFGGYGGTPFTGFGGTPYSGTPFNGFNSGWNNQTPFYGQNWSGWNNAFQGSSPNTGFNGWNGGNWNGGNWNNTNWNNSASTFPGYSGWNTSYANQAVPFVGTGWTPFSGTGGQGWNGVPFGGFNGWNTPWNQATPFGAFPFGWWSQAAGQTVPTTGTEHTASGPVNQPVYPFPFGGFNPYFCSNPKVNGTPATQAA